MTDLIRAADLSRSSAYRLVDRLQAVDYLVQDSSGQWRLGPAAARLAMAAVHATEVVNVAPEYLRMLVQQTRETVGFAVLSGDEMIFVYRELGPQWGVQVNDMALVNVNFGGITQPFTVQLQVALFVGFILASPVWLYQVWGFIVPGLTKREKRTTMLFVGAAVPLFLGGCFLATKVVPKAVEVLLGFTPQGAANLPDAALYLTFVTRFILAFGLAFLLPVFLVGLNVAHILPARVMLKGWRIAVILIFVFSAMMTPTPDAWTMLALAFPMIALFYGAVGVSALLDRRRSRHEPEWLKVPDDEASPL